MRGVWPVIGRKLIAESAVLGRLFHADVFDPCCDPRGIVLCVGGSGQTERVYASRQQQVNPVFESVWPYFAEARFRFVFLTAPYDVPFADPVRFESHRQRWNSHIRHEVLAHWPSLPVYLMGYSGGITLILSGVHQDPRVLGAAGLGADGIPETFEPPFCEGKVPRWQLDLFYNRRDPLRAMNSEMVEELVAAGMAREHVTGEGGHRFIDYIHSGTLTLLLKQLPVHWL